MSQNDSTATSASRRFHFGNSRRAARWQPRSLSMGTANATPFVDPYLPPDPYDVLFGAQGTQGVGQQHS